MRFPEFEKCGLVLFYAVVIVVSILIMIAFPYTCGAATYHAATTGSPTATGADSANAWTWERLINNAVMTAGDTDTQTQILLKLFPFISEKISGFDNPSSVKNLNESLSLISDS